MHAAKGMPLYAGPNKTSNLGSGFDPDDREVAIVDAYASANVARIGPVLIKPALKKYGDMLEWIQRRRVIIAEKGRKGTG